MSPATLRRYRAERLLERDFAALRSIVLATVGARLRSSGASLDPAELDACYATAWQGLYAAALKGDRIVNTRAWLTLVTYRRAIEELRSPRRGEEPLPAQAAVEQDLAGELDDRQRLRNLLQGMRARLDLREREAAALCYLHGYSRGEAARLMGVSETRMRKLMEGSKGRAGVSAKLGELVETIRDGSFCEQQGSLMRALAFGVLDPGGERYRLAVVHRSDCPACRHYVATLRGAAVLLPPVLTLPGGGAAGLFAGAGIGHHAAAGQATASLPSLGASAATGGGAGAGGSWALGSGLTAKLAAGCLLAVGIGAGCVAIERGAPQRDGPAPRPAAAPPPAGASAPAALAARVATARRARPGGQSRARGPAATVPASSRGREFSLEQPIGSTRPPRTSQPLVATAQTGAGRTPPQPAPPTSASVAEHEFAPG
ncbi:MAG TPA: sigma-70 family RNA polymerase sigma factor [Solirubrobacteraceae bacterium]